MENDKLDESMKLIEEEKQQLLDAKDEKSWYQICEKIKERRNGQYPSYLAREILELYQDKFTKLLS